MPSRNQKKRATSGIPSKARRYESKAKARARYKADPEKKKSVRDSYKADPEKKKASVRDSYKSNPEKKKASVRATATRPIPKRRRPLYATATRPIPKRRRPLYATATTQILNLSNLLKGSDIKRTSRRTVLLKGSDIKRTSRRTALLKGRNTRTIQLPLRHLKGIGIGMTPLSDWLNVLPRGSGVTELPLPPKALVWTCSVLVSTGTKQLCNLWVPAMVLALELQQGFFIAPFFSGDEFKSDAL
eukprot:Em0005g530a